MYLAWQVPHNVYEVPDAYRDPSIDCSGRQTIEAMIHMMDEGVANVTSALERRGLWNSTLFIFLADNGGLLHGGTYGSNYPLRGSKTTAFEGGVRTLAFVSGGYLAAALHATLQAPALHGFCRLQRCISTAWARMNRLPVKPARAPCWTVRSQ